MAREPRNWEQRVHPADQEVLDNAAYYVTTIFPKPREQPHYEQVRFNTLWEAVQGQPPRSLIYACTKQGRYAVVPKSTIDALKGVSKDVHHP